MKRAAIGGILALIGFLWALAALLAGSAYMDRVSSWYTPPGRYGTALLESGMALGAALLLLGLAALGLAYFKKEE